MSLREMAKSVLHRAQAAEASGGLLFPLPMTKASDPEPISLSSWLNLRVDDRAPARAIAVVALGPHDFSAIVIDTVADQARWRVTGEREHLAHLYDGMGGRGTGVISSQQLLSYDAGDESGGEPQNEGGECSDCPSYPPPPPPPMAVVRKPGSDGGPEGTDWILLKMADLLSQVLSARPVQILEPIEYGRRARAQALFVRFDLRQTRR